MIENTTILIPAYMPQNTLPKLVEELSSLGFSNILVVDDGSGLEFAPVFSRLRDSGKATVITHGDNKGKGAALKTGFRYIWENAPNCTFVITADADGQHTPADIRAVAQTASQNPQAMVLGVRQLDQMVPKSRFGNTITHWIFKVFFRLEISDTQTGLRSIPREFIPACLEIPYERYEFESEMLLISRGEGVKIVEQPIETIYIDDNKNSHFNPIIDSTKIYFVLFRYTLASLASAAVDYLIFYVLFNAFQNVSLGIFGARLVSLVVNYLLLQYKVFYSRRRVRITFPRYVLLVIFSGVLASTFISLLNERAGWNVIVAKVLVETLIYFFNFAMNTLLVFMGKSWGEAKK